MEKFVGKLKSKYNLYSCSFESSHGMGSFETFYISFQKTEENEAYTIRFSGHNASNMSDFYLWNDRFSTITEMKKAINEIIERM